MISFRIYSLLFLLQLVIATNCIASPFPIKGRISDGEDRHLGTAFVYPRFVEIYNPENKKIGKVGIVVEQGLAKLFLIKQNDSLSLVGYASGGKIFNAKDKVVGEYFWTPTWSFAYWPGGKLAGKVKCIAWPRVCSVGVAGYLLKLFDDKNENPP